MKQLCRRQRGAAINPACRRHSKQGAQGRRCQGPGGILWRSRQAVQALADGLGASGPTPPDEVCVPAPGLVVWHCCTSNVAPSLLSVCWGASWSVRSRAAVGVAQASLGQAPPARVSFQAQAQTVIMCVTGRALCLEAPVNCGPRVCADVRPCPPRRWAESARMMGAGPSGCIMTRNPGEMRASPATLEGISPRALAHCPPPHRQWPNPQLGGFPLVHLPPFTSLSCC